MSSTSSSKMANGSAHGGKVVRHRAQFRKFALHTMAAAQMIYGFSSLNSLALQGHVEAQYGGFAQFLTIIGLFASCFTMLLSGINDLLQIPIVSRIKRASLLFSMPVELVIASIYWPLVLFAPSLMFPPAPTSIQQEEPSSTAETLLFRIPLSLDLSLHALPAVAMVLDFFVLEQKFTPPASKIGAPLLALVFGTGYALWVEHCATINGRFPYPFLNVMGPTSRVVLYSTATLGSLLAFRALNWAHR